MGNRIISKDEWIEEYVVAYIMWENTFLIMKRNFKLKKIETEQMNVFLYLFFFLRFVEKYAAEIGDDQRPFSVFTWEKAYELWERHFQIMWKKGWLN